MSDNTNKKDIFTPVSFEESIDFERSIRCDDTTMVYAILLIHYPDLSDQELRVCRAIVGTMWDSHDDVARYEQVVARELPYEYFMCREDIPEELLENERPCFFISPEEIQEIIGRLVNKGVFQDTEIEFRYGLEGHQTARMERVLIFGRGELYENIDKMRMRLGVYY